MSESDQIDLPQMNSSEWPSDYFATSLHEMADTITRLELWNWFQTENPPQGEGYCWWEHENIKKISNNLPNNDHTGYSFSCAMRNMQYIAKNGFIAWKKEYTKKKPDMPE